MGVDRGKCQRGVKVGGGAGNGNGNGNGNGSGSGSGSGSDSDIIIGEDPTELIKLDELDIKMEDKIEISNVIIDSDPWFIIGIICIIVAIIITICSISRTQDTTF